MNFKEALILNPTAFVDICKSYDVRNVYAFGSSVNGNFSDTESDIDLLIELKTKDPIK